MSLPFPSPEWTAELCQAINSSRTYASAAKKWEGDIVLVIEEQAGVYLDLWHGQCRGAKYLDNPTEMDAAFKITATMEQWVQILQGEMDPIQGLMKRRLKLDGNLVIILKNIKAAQELVACAAGIDTDFGQQR